MAQYVTEPAGEDSRQAAAAFGQSQKQAGGNALHDPSTNAAQHTSC